jgi:hypothetical protein
LTAFGRASAAPEGGVEEIRATGKCTIPQRITAEIKAGNCACEIRNPQGFCCLGNVNAAVKRAMSEIATP